MVYLKQEIGLVTLPSINIAMTDHSLYRAYGIIRHTYYNNNDDQNMATKLLYKNDPQRNMQCVEITIQLCRCYT